MNSDKMHLDFGFVPMGRVAPNPLPAGELWLDVGNRVGPMVLDHHGGNTEAWSASQLVLESIKDLVIPYTRSLDAVRIVLHTEPDLDAICSAWLVKKCLVEGINIQTANHIHTIVEAVNENDQGLVKTSDALHCWPIVMRSLIGGVIGEEVNDVKIRAWFDLLDKTLETLQKGCSLDEAANVVATPELRVILCQEHRDYQHDIEMGSIFQIMLPLQSHFSLQASAAESAQKERRVLCDALVLRNPSSRLFKELAHGDARDSPQKGGFSLLVVSWDIPLKDGRNLSRYIISTDPLTGLHLRGLGSLLEEREQRKEDMGGGPYLPGRERVERGKGRFGWNVISPWYDGRGHNYTIVDSPSIQIDGGVCVSQLSIEEVLETLWEFCDPALFVEIDQAMLIGLRVSISAPKSEKSVPVSLLSETLSHHPELGIYWSSDFLSLAEDVFVSRPEARTSADKDQRVGCDQEEWRLFSNILISIKKRTMLAVPVSLREVTSTVSSLRKAYNQDQQDCSSLPSGCGPAIFLLFIKINPRTATFSQETPAWRLGMFRLVSGLGAGFPQSDEYEGASSMQRIAADQGRTQFLSVPSGYLVFTLEESPQPTGSLTDGDRLPADSVIPVIAFAHAIKSYLAHLSSEFIVHLRCRRTSKMSKLLLEDRERLFWFEHSMPLQMICSHAFLQEIFEKIKSQLEIGARFRNANHQIRRLAEAMKESRANLLSKLSFILTTAFTPLLLTLSFFGGRFLDKEYSQRYKIFLPERWTQWVSQNLGIGQGVAAFLAVLFLMYLILATAWIILGLGHRKRMARARADESSKRHKMGSPK